MSDYSIILQQNVVLYGILHHRYSEYMHHFLEAVSCFVAIQIIHIYKSRLTASKILIYFG